MNQVAPAITRYTSAMIEREARIMARDHAKMHNNGRAFGVTWEIVVQNDHAPALVVSYAANGKAGKCGVYHCSEAM